MAVMLLVSNARKFPTACLAFAAPIGRLMARHPQVPLEISKDAGRFVCNYTYYLSLSHCQAFPNKRWRHHDGIHCLFVHVPPFECIDEETQVDTLLSLFEELRHVVDVVLEQSDEVEKSNAIAETDESVSCEERLFYWRRWCCCLR